MLLRAQGKQRRKDCREAGSNSKLGRHCTRY
jgi:hypothetical protein